MDAGECEGCGARAAYVTLDGDGFCADCVADGLAELEDGERLQALDEDGDDW